MDEYSDELFGIASDSLAIDASDPVSLRATQQIGTVPVRDGILVFGTSAGSASTSTGVRVSSVRGRVFPGL